MKPTREGTLWDLERIKSRLSRAYVKGELTKAVFDEMLETVHKLEDQVKTNLLAGEGDANDKVID